MQIVGERKNNSVRSVDDIRKRILLDVSESQGDPWIKFCFRAKHPFDRGQGGLAGDDQTRARICQCSKGIEKFINTFVGAYLTKEYINAEI